MNMLYLILLICGALLGIVLLCLGVIYLQKKFPTEEFDERQMQAKGKASQLGMITGMIYFLVVIVVLLNQVDNEKRVEPWLLVFIGVLLMVTVDNTYCFLTNASMPLSSKPIPTIVCYTILGLVQLFFIWNLLDDFPITLVGHGTSGWLHLLAGISFLYLALMQLIQYLRDRRE